LFIFVLILTLQNFCFSAVNEDSDAIIRKAAHITPSRPQLAWLESEFNAFLHFTVNTFTDREWGEGTEDPAVFNPTDFDARQWIQVCKEAGMKMVVLTAKHHDGFCLWPSQYTEHSVKNSPWRDGKGDVVREVSDACRELGIKFGIYLSPWDRHEPSYGDSPRYNEFFKNQLRELLTNYGEIHEVWFDGACGEGPDGRKQVYDIQNGCMGLIRQLQPEAVIMAGDCYVTDETGYGRETEWMAVPRFIQTSGSLYEPQNIGAIVAYITRPDFGSRAFVVEAVTEHHYPLDWWVSENIVSIRPGWFYHAKEDNQVKSLEKLLDIYYSSVGRNGPLLLNLPPDRRGRIHEVDAQRMREMGKVLKATFKTDLAYGATAKASQIRNNNPAYSAANVVDGDKNTYWITDDGVTTATIELDLGETKTFNLVVLQEFIQRGQRIEEFVFDAWDGENWQELARGTTIGYKRMLRTDNTAAQKVRLRIMQSRVCPTISCLSLFYAPPIDEKLKN
jgi:alpha-L-fucosidase